MTIADIEKAVIDRLKAKIQGLPVEGFPEMPSEYALLHAKGAILVNYAGSQFSGPKPTDIVYQERKVEFNVTVAMRRLRSHEGAYAHLDAVRTALTGHSIPGCSKMYPTREGFVSEGGGVWQYTMTFAMTMPAIEAAVDEALPLLKKATAADGYGGAQAPYQI